MLKVHTPTQAELALLPATSQPGETHPACHACGLFRSSAQPIMQSLVTGTWTRKLVVIHGHPEPPDVLKLTRQLATAAGYQREDLAMTYACRCLPPNDAVPTMAQLRYCRPFMLRFLAKYEPDRVVLAGSTALKSALNSGVSANVTQWRGKPLTIPGVDMPSVYATYQPAAILKGSTHLRVRIHEDLTRHSLPKLDYPEKAWPTV